MTDDLVGRLRAYRPPNEWGDGVKHVICDEAAARIEALEAENRKLRDGLEHIVSECGRMRNGTDDWFDLADMSMSARNFLVKDSPHAD